MEQAIGILKSEQQRADNPAIGLKVYQFPKCWFAWAAGLAHRVIWPAVL
jgi:hypothetical protein